MEGMEGNTEFKDTLWHGWHHSQCGSQALGKLVEIVLLEFQQKIHYSYSGLRGNSINSCTWWYPARMAAVAFEILSAEKTFDYALWGDTQQAFNLTTVIICDIFICTEHNSLLLSCSFWKAFFFFQFSISSRGSNQKCLNVLNLY